MARLQNQADSKFVILLWGPALSGKTVLASQFPNPYFIDLDGQLGSVRALAQKHGQDVDFPVITLDESETDDPDFLALVDKRFAKMSAWTKTKKLVEKLSQKLEPDQTLVFDNLSRANEYLLNHIKHQTGRSALQIQDWGTFVDEMSILVDYLHSRYTKCNTILIGHESSKKDEMTGELFKSLLMPTSFSDRVPSKASDFLYMNVTVTGPKNKRVIKRQLQSVPDPKNPLGSRSMIPNLISPTYEKMRPYLESYIGRKLGEPTWTPPEETLSEEA